MDNGALTLLGYSLSNLLNRPQDSHDHEAISVVAQFAQAYTRGLGFDPVTGNPNDDIAAVILTAAARLLASPGQLERKGIGSLTISYNAFNGFTLGERMVLNRYRQRTA